MEQNRKPKHKFIEIQPSDFDIDAKITHWRKEFSRNVSGKTMSKSRKITLALYLLCCTKINSK